MIRVRDRGLVMPFAEPSLSHLVAEQLSRHGACVGEVSAPFGREIGREVWILQVRVRVKSRVRVRARAKVRVRVRVRSDTIDPAWLNPAHREPVGLRGKLRGIARVGSMKAMKISEMAGIRVEAAIQNTARKVASQLLMG